MQHLGPTAQLLATEQISDINLNHNLIAAANCFMINCSIAHITAVRQQFFHIHQHVIRLMYRPFIFSTSQFLISTLHIEDQYLPSSRSGDNRLLSSFNSDIHFLFTRCNYQEHLLYFKLNVKILSSKIFHRRRLVLHWSNTYANLRLTHNNRRFICT